MSENPVYLFVYGTLQPGFTNPFAQFLHQNSQHVGYGTLRGQLYDIGHYPGVRYEPDGADVVHGSLYALNSPADLLAHLDEYESVSNPPAPTDEYVRAIVPIRFGDDEVRCWIYLYNWPVATDQRIASGRYGLQ